jgi:predicted transcriptional regulator
LRRKFLAAKEDLVEKVGKIARRRHQTLYWLINKTLEQVIKANNFNRSLEEVTDQQLAIEALREGGYVLVPEDLLYKVVDKAFELDKESLVNMWYESGRWSGQYILTRFPEEDRLNTFQRMVRSLVWSLSEFKVDKEKDRIVIRCIGPRIPLSYSTLLSSFIEGVLQAFGYKVVEKSVSAGIVFMVLKK